MGKAILLARRGLIFMIFRGFWGLFFVFLGGCRGGKSSVSSRRNACFCIFALQIQIAKNLIKKRTSPCQTARKCSVSEGRFLLILVSLGQHAIHDIEYWRILKKETKVVTTRMWVCNRKNLRIKLLYALIIIEYAKLCIKDALSTKNGASFQNLSRVLTGIIRASNFRW